MARSLTARDGPLFHADTIWRMKDYCLHRGREFRVRHVLPFYARFLVLWEQRVRLQNSGDKPRELQLPYWGLPYGLRTGYSYPALSYLRYLGGYLPYLCR